MTKRYTRVLALLLVLLTFTTVLLAGCKDADDTTTPTTEEIDTTQPEKQTETTEPPVQETEPPRTPGMYRITVLPTANGTVTADRTEAKEGEKITLTVTPDKGYEVITLIVNDRHGEETFDMPAEDVTVLARFGYPEGVDFKEYPNGDFFGSVGTLHSSDVLDMSTDSGKNPYLVMDAGKATPLYAYVKGMTDDQFYLELTAKVTGIRSDENYPKFGLMTNDGAEMVKFYLDMTKDKQVGTVGAVHQASGKGDDWAGHSTWKLNKALNLKSQTVKLALLRNGKNYYFYVNGVLAATGNDLSGKDAAAGIFSFGTSLKVTDYKLIRSENEINSLLNKAKADIVAFNGLSLSENYFSQVSDGVYSLTTNSDAQHLVDDVISAGKVVREQYYSLKGKLSLTNASDWGQARILISADAQNEYFIALEKNGEDSYQIFTMSKANEEGWNNWQLIDGSELNGSRNSIDFEVIVVGDVLYFVIDDQVYYTSNRVSMTESTVKFTGYNAGTTTVENLTMEVFANEAAAQAYADSKQSRFGENFGVSQNTYWTTSGVDLTNDNGENPTVSVVGGAPQYAYLNDILTDKFCFETEFNVMAVLNNDAYPKFGIMVKDSKEMVKFFVDMTAEMTASKVGVVYQPAGGGDDWENSASCDVTGMVFTGSNTVKLKLIRDGEFYYFYVNDQLVLFSEEGFEAEQGAVGIFSFNGVLTTRNYTIAIDDAANGAIEQAKEDLISLNKLGLTTNFFAETTENVYTLTTNSDAQHLVDDVILAGKVVREQYYSLKGKLSLTDAGDWGQARILISADAQNEYVIALEKTNSGKYQIFTMSKAAEEGWNNWTLIDDVEQNGSRNSIDFEIIVIGDELYFLIDDAVYYTSNRVSMTESTVKFTGYNAGTTTVENLALEVFDDEAAAQAYADSKQSRFGENFGVSQNTYWTTNGVDLTNDNGENPTVSFVEGAPQYAYWNNVFTDKFCFETEFNVTAVLNNDAYPKFGIMVNGTPEMVKFFVDMTAEMTAENVGVVYQPTGGGDDWADSVSAAVPGMAFTGSDTVKLKVIRDGTAYYFYVNDKLALYNEAGFETEQCAVGIFSFNGVLTASNYTIIMDDAANGAIEQAKIDVQNLSKVSLSTNYFSETEDGVYSLSTNSNAEDKVDDVLLGNEVLKTAHYSVSGKLSLLNANDWGQARILVSSDAQNEYFIALEKTGSNSYQIFSMSKANEEGWNEWKLIESASHNGNRSVLDFELIVIGDQMYFLIEDKICYISDRISMTESTVKFTGYNVGTTTVENLAVQVFSDSSEAEAYAAGKNSRIGENFGVSEGTYFTTDGVSLANDKGDHATVSFVGGAPQYAYLHDLHTDKFCFETQVNVTAVLNNDGYPKFGMMVNGSSEMVKFFVDMTPAMKATHVGVVYQPTGGGDDWANSRSVNVPGMAFTGSDTIKLKLVREGRAYYFYVNDNLVIYDENGFKAEKGAVGLFSFNAAMIASNYSALTGSDANSAVQSAKDTVAAQLSKITLSTNWFADNGNGVYTLTTNSNAEHKVDDLNRGGSVLRTAYYSVKGKLTLTDAGNWGQARILISSDANNEYFIALERTDQGKFQIFTMSKRNRNYWYDWIEILHADVNGTRNSIDFELIVIGNRLYFLIDDTVVYSDTSVSLTESTVKFTGYNVGTTTVENLSAEVFENRQDAESYLAEKTA